MGAKHCQLHIVQHTASYAWHKYSYPRCMRFSEQLTTADSQWPDGGAPNLD
jgi:hypothetical protein